MILMFSVRRMAAVAVVPLLLAAGCASAPAQAKDGRLSVVVGFYPLQFIAQRVAGRHAEVVNLTQPGTEPHDLELRPRDLATLERAALAITLDGLQPAVDDAVADQDNVLDVATSADLADHGDADGHGHADLHFWLDPVRMGSVAEAVADRLAQRDPSHAGDYAANAAVLVEDLKALDAQFTSGLQDCQNRYLVTSHEAFGYLAARYRFTQLGITGPYPETEPTGTDLANAVAFVRDHHVTTIYSEPLSESKVAQTVADSAGITTATLDPIEGITPESKGSDYLAVMRSNLSTLQAGQGCTR